MDRPLYCTVALSLCVIGHHNFYYACMYVCMYLLWLCCTTNPQQTEAVEFEPKQVSAALVMGLARCATDSQCDKLAKFFGRTSTAASTVNVVRRPRRSSVHYTERPHVSTVCFVSPSYPMLGQAEPLGRFEQILCMYVVSPNYQYQSSKETQSSDSSQRSHQVASSFLNSRV